MHRSMGLSIAALSRGVTDTLCDAWRDVWAILLDEVSLVSPRLLGALSYRACLARKRSHGCDPLLYAEKAERFGRVPLVVLAGDFMQLPPFEGKARCSLVRLAHHTAFIEHLNGIKLFRDGIDDVVILPKTFRFVDRTISPPAPCPVLPRLFEFMREPEAHGGQLPDVLGVL